MGNLGEQDGYPVGVSNADFIDDDAPCMCGHALDEHEDGEGPCTVADCDCAHAERDYEDA